MSRGHPTIPNAIRVHLPRNVGLLLGVSGGIDSVVLLHACVAASVELGLKLEVAHLDHGLRSESAADSDFVRSLAETFELPFHVKTAGQKPADQNVESWGRAVRYEFFAEILAKRGLDFIVTAHQADDVAETLLMRLLANKEPGELSRFDARRRLIRPLLDVPRILVENYAREHGLQWREDSSNSDETFLRNKVRLSLLPVLREQFDPRIIEVLSSRAQGLAQDGQALEAWAASEAKRLQSLAFGSREWLTAVRAVLGALEPALQWRVARNVLAEHLGFRLGRSRSEPLVAFFLGGSEGIELPGGIRLRRRDGGILLSKPA